MALTALRLEMKVGVPRCKNAFGADGESLLALASLNRACRDLVPSYYATLTTIAFGNRSLQWLEASSLTAGLEGPSLHLS